MEHVPIGLALNDLVTRLARLVRIRAECREIQSVTWSVELGRLDGIGESGRLIGAAESPDGADRALGGTGLEPVTLNTCNNNDLRHSSNESGAESGAVECDSAPSAPDSSISGGPADPTLTYLIEIWPSLSDGAKREIGAVLQRYADDALGTPSKGEQR